MSSIVVEPQLSERLKSQSEPAELVDASGNVLGHFVPVSSRYASEWVPELDRAGFEAALAEGGGVSTAELLALLGRP